MSLTKGILLPVFLMLTSFALAQENNMKKIDGGKFIPLYGIDSTIVSIDAFMMDVYPITNQEFLDFVKTNPSWQRSKVKRLFADEGYLSQWKNDTILAEGMLLKSPVTRISWYSAKAYCGAHGKRLPTMDEWEYAAMASEAKPNAQRDSIFNQRIIASYETPKTSLKEVGSTYKNYWGVYDMHGLVWEWTSDFNSVMISGESRQDVDTERNLFCAAGSVSAGNLMDYAAFMRYAFRGSIKANYSIQSLGFRCAKNIQ